MNKFKNILWEYIKTFLTSLLFVLFFINFIAIPVKVSGSSMLPNLNNGDFGFSGIITKAFGYNRFDIVVLKKYDSNDKIVKRIIGLPAETVQIDKEGKIYIDGEVLEESYGAEVIRPEYIGIAAEEILLGEDEYFVLGDNRNNSKDSRMPEVGNIDREDIIGRAWVRIWPLKDFEVIAHQ